LSDRFEIVANSAKRAHALPEAWPAATLRALMDTLPGGDLGEVEDADLAEVIGMVLADGDVIEGAESVIDFRVHDGSSDGRREQLAHEFKDEHPWVEYPTLSAHADLFAVAMLLHDVWPSEFGTPSLTRVELGITALDAEAAGDLAELSPALLVRLIGAADPGSILARLFDEAIEGSVPFPDAPYILWRVEVLESDESSATVAVWSSMRWLEGIQRGQAWTSSARPDPADEEEE